MSRIYVASSWRNVHQPAVVDLLRLAGHDVYDFRNPDPADLSNHGFGWRQVDPDRSSGDLVDVERWRAMVDHPIALRAHRLDFTAMAAADVCVYVLPCGRSASFEAGWSSARGKRVIVVALEPTEPELMLRDATFVGSLEELIAAVAS